MENKKNKIIKISGFIIFLIILATTCSFGVFTFFKNIDNRDNANSLAYLGIMEDGTYYVQDAPKNIRFQVTSEDNSLYKITNSNGEKVSSKIVVNNGKKFIQSENNYNEGETYLLELSEGINFTDNALKYAKTLKFNITEKEKANYELNENVKKDINTNNLLVQENDGVKTVDISNTEYKTNDILIINNYPYKIDSIDDNIAQLSKPDLSDIYKELDLHKKEKINFNNIEIDDKFKDQIEVGVKNSEFFKLIESQVYAADDVKTGINIIPNGKNLKMEIEIKVAPQGTPFLGIQSLKEHGVKFKFIIDLTSEYIADVKLGKNVDMGVTTNEKIKFDIEIYSNNKFFKGVSELSDEEYSKTVQDLFTKLEQAELDRTEGKARLISGIEVPTGIWGVNVYFDVYFQTSIAIQLKATYNQTLEFKQVAGINGDSNGLKPYSNGIVVNSTIEVGFQGKAEAKVGIGIDVGLSFISKDFAHAGLGMEMGMYDGAYALINSEIKTGEKISANVMTNMRMEAGIYFELKYSAVIDFKIYKISAEGSIAEARKPLLKVGSDEIVKSIESSPNVIYIQDGKANVPTIYRNIKNLNTKEERKEDCTAEIEFTNVDNSKIEITNGKLNLQSNDVKAVFATYKAKGGIYTIEIPVSSTPVQANNTNKSGTSFGTATSGTSVIDIYKNFVKTKKYREYTSKAEGWKRYNSKTKRNEEALVLRYAILDINKDGTPELLCEGETIDFESVWKCTLVVTYNKSTNQLVLVDDIYSYASLAYDSKDQAIRYTNVRPSSLIASYISYKLVNNQLQAYKIYSYDISGTIGSSTYGGYPAIIRIKNLATGEEKNYNTVQEVTDEMKKNTSEIKYIDVSSL